jgi:hypothetical protein
MTREEVTDICSLKDVEDRAQAAVNKVATEQPRLPPAVFGTKVHWEYEGRYRIPWQFRFPRRAILPQGGRNTALQAGRYRYGTRGSVRIDVFEKVRDDLVCVYDLKTGTRGLSIPRMIEISTRVLRHFPPQARVIVTEVRVPR